MIVHEWINSYLDRHFAFSLPAWPLFWTKKQQCVPRARPLAANYCTGCSSIDFALSLPAARLSALHWTEDSCLPRTRPPAPAIHKNREEDRGPFEVFDDGNVAFCNKTPKVLNVLSISHASKYFELVLAPHYSRTDGRVKLATWTHT